MSIVRVGLAETGKFSEGYDAIFGGRRIPAAKPAPAAKRNAVRKKPAKKTK